MNQYSRNKRARRSSARLFLEKTMINQDNLNQFCGDEERYRHWTRRLIFTPGVKYVADNGGQHGAYWLLDAIASYQPEPVVKKNPKLREFQVWILTVDREAHTAVLRMSDGGDPKPLVEQQIEYTDFDLAAITIWAEDNGDGMTLLLPSEH
jgi:hypothetical protein